MLELQRGWVLCHGQSLPVGSYQALFEIIGTTYGGDGKTTFKLPDLRGRVPVSSGEGPDRYPFPLGSSGGALSTRLAVDNLPKHDHDPQITGGEVKIKVSDKPGNATIATGSALGVIANDVDTGATIEMYDNNPSFVNGYSLVGVEYESPQITLQPVGANRPVSHI